MLKRDLTEALVLLVFSVLLFEYLTIVSIAVVMAGLICIVIQWRPKKIVRNILALIVLASYWIKFGKVIDPEVGLNFLTTVIVLKLLEKETARDQYMIFFGLLLIISAGSLFEKTLMYTVFFTISFLILLKDFYQGLELKRGLKDFGLLFIWVLPLTFSLYFLLPRLMNPIPFKSHQQRPGEIGYTPGVQVSSIDKLEANDAPAFQALVSRKMPQNQLYWRGNSVSQTDGWNWSATSMDGQIGLVDTGIEGVVSQEIRLFIKEDYLFALDRPLEFSISGQKLKGSRLTKLRSWPYRYEVKSLPGGVLATTEQTLLTRVGFAKKDSKWINETFRGKSVAEIERELREYFFGNGFVYSLAPGVIHSFRDFMTKSRIGFCSHYASALGIILRTKGIPARLVSGFMGGAYNDFGNFYLISQNDAHAWVEAYEHGRWIRLDPTEWVSPDRVRLGGEAFMAEVRPGAFGLRKFPGLSYFAEFKMWLSQWDFKFYQWLEQVDYFTQSAWLSRFGFKREWFYALTPLLLLIFALVYALGLSRKRRRSDQTEAEILWGQFMKRLKKQKLDLPLTSVAADEAYLKDAPVLLEIYRRLIRLSFGNKADSDLKDKIREL